MTDCKKCLKIEQIREKIEEIGEKKKIEEEKAKLDETPKEKRSVYKWREAWDYAEGEIAKLKKELTKLNKQKKTLEKHTCVEEDSSSSHGSGSGSLGEETPKKPRLYTIKEVREMVDDEVNIAWKEWKKRFNNLSEAYHETHTSRFRFMQKVREDKQETQEKHEKEIERIKNTAKKIYENLREEFRKYREEAEKDLPKLRVFVQGLMNQNKILTFKLAEEEEKLANLKNDNQETLFAHGNEKLTLNSQIKEQEQTIQDLKANLKTIQNLAGRIISETEQEKNASQATNGLLAQILVEVNADFNSEKIRADNLQNWKDKHTCPTPDNTELENTKKERDNWKKQAEEHTCPDIDNTELESLRQETKDKDKKIAELEAEISELKNPPTPDNSENNSKLNNFLTERTNLLTTIQEKETIIKELEIKLQEQASKEIIKEVKVENREIIERLKLEIRDNKNQLKQLRYYSWFISGVCILLLYGLVKLLRKKRLKK